MVRVHPLIPALTLACVVACGGDTTPPAPAGPDPALQAEVEGYLAAYTETFVGLYTASSEAEWAANTRIVEGDDTNRTRSEAAQAALTAFTGSVENIEKARAYLASKDRVSPLAVRQLEQVLYAAGNFPQTVPELVKERIAAEAKANEVLFGFDFKVDGRSMSANDIDDLLDASRDLAARQAAWEASKEVGRPLRPALLEMTSLRNRTVQALGYQDFFAYQVSDYGMTSAEMMQLLKGVVRDVWPLYRELHTWARYELAARYGVAEVPDLLPAHWLPNRWGQDWAAAVKVEGLDLDAVLAPKDPEWLIRQGEEFYVSLGFDPLPTSFYEKSSLYPLPADATYKKNNHASAWHMDLGNDLRSLMSVQPNQRWWNTVHHELGHIYYYQAYSVPEVPVLLRGGANRAFHEGVGTLLGMASGHKAFLEGRGLIPPGTQTDDTQALLREALDSVVFLPFAAGTMSHFEHDLFAGTIPPEALNQRWWDYVLQYQGIEPPGPRGEELCDACTKTHVINDAAQYYDYALSYVFLHQIHAHVAANVLKQDPRNTNYFGSKETGTFLRGLLAAGATRDWRELLREKLGQDISAKPMLEYFAPLVDYLKQQNAGRTYTLPELRTAS